MTKLETDDIKGIAISFMLLLHLFNTYNYHDIYTPYLLINGTPLTFYISLFADNCVVLFLFCSGYGLYASYKKAGSTEQYIKSFTRRLKSLYIKYWIILVLFCFILGPLLGESGYPGSWQTILLNLTAIDTSYNGAWWFFTTYVLCLLLSPILFKLIDRYNVSLVILMFFVIYTVVYIQRFKAVLVISNPQLQWLVTEAALLANSLLPFVIGAYFIKFNLLSVIKYRLEYCFSRFAINVVMLMNLVFMFIAKTYVPTLYTAIFTGIGLVVCYLLIDKPKIISSTLAYLGDHSSNIWLTHMFFYLIFAAFSQYVYLTSDPIMIFSTLLFMCISVSYFINFFERKFQFQRIGSNQRDSNT